MDIYVVVSCEILFMQLLVLLCKSSFVEEVINNDVWLNQLLVWFEDYFVQEICWEEVVVQFLLLLCMLYCQLKQQIGLMLQCYFNWVCLMKVCYLLCYSDESVIDIVYCCGFGDSNYFLMFFCWEFDWLLCDICQGCDVIFQ